MDWRIRTTIIVTAAMLLGFLCTKVISHDIQERQKIARYRTEIKAMLDSCKALQKRFGAIQPYQKGVASFYGDIHQGKTMANGKPFDKTHNTMAHRTLPLGTICIIYNPATGLAVADTVTDRGPFVGSDAINPVFAHLPDRIADMSETSAKAIGLTLGTVEIYVVKNVHPRPSSGKDRTLYARKQGKRILHNHMQGKVLQTSRKDGRVQAKHRRLQTRITKKAPVQQLSVY